MGSPPRPVLYVDGKALEYHHYPANWPLRVDDYRQMMERHGKMKTHVPLFWSQLPAGATLQDMRDWYKNNIRNTCHAESDARFRAKLLHLFGESRAVSSRLRRGILCYDSIDWQRERWDHADFKNHQRLQQEFRDYYEATVKSRDGKKPLNMEHSLGLKISQAFAELATGPVVLLFASPEFNVWDPRPRNTAWEVAEFGALLRNESIRQIYQVDLAKGVIWDENTGDLIHPVLVWDREREGVLEGYEPMGGMWAFGREYHERSYEECPAMDWVAGFRRSQAKSSSRFS